MASGRRKLLLRVDRHAQQNLLFTGFFLGQRKSVPCYVFGYIVRLLAVDLEHATNRSNRDDWGTLTHDPEMYQVDIWMLNEPLLWRVAELTTVMLITAGFAGRFGGTSSSESGDGDPCVSLGGLRAIVCANERSKVLLDELAPNLRFMGFWVACMLAKVIVREDTLGGLDLYLTGVNGLLTLVTYG